MIDFLMCFSMENKEATDALVYASLQNAQKTTGFWAQCNLLKVQFTQSNQ